jgi:hypothetical protein
MFNFVIHAKRSINIRTKQIIEEIIKRNEAEVNQMFNSWFFTTPSIATKFQYINSLLFC